MTIVRIVSWGCVYLVKQMPDALVIGSVELQAPPPLVHNETVGTPSASNGGAPGKPVHVCTSGRAEPTRRNILNRYFFRGAELRFRDA